MTSADVNSAAPFERILVVAEHDVRIQAGRQRNHAFAYSAIAPQSSSRSVGF